MAAPAILCLLVAASCTHRPESLPTLPVTTLSPSPSADPAPSPSGSQVLKLLYVSDGPGPIQNEPTFQGAELAIEAATAGQFGPLRVEVQLVPLSLQGDAVAVLTAVSQTLDDGSVVGVIGPTSSRSTFALGPLLDRIGIPFVSFATDPRLGTLGWRHFFRAVVDDNTISATAALYIGRVLKPTCAYLVSDGTPYGSNLAAGVAAALPGEGVGVLPPQADVVDAGGPAAVAKRIQATGCGAVFYGGGSASGARLATAMSAVGLKGVALLGADALRTGAFLTLAGAAAKGTIAACACADLIGSTDPAAASFVSAFDTRFGAAPGPFAAEAWDAVEMFVAAFKAGVTQRQRVRNFIESFSGFPGLTKAYTPQPTGGGNIAPPTAVFLYRDDGAHWVPLPTSDLLLGG